MLGHDCIQLYTFSIAGSLRNILKFHDISLRYFYITGHWTMIFFPLYDLIKSKWDIHFLQTAFFSKYCYCFRLMNFYWFQIHTRKRILFEKTTFQRLFHRTSIPNFYPHVFIPKDCFQILSSDALPVYIWISEMGQPLQTYFWLYRQFTITKAEEECDPGDILFSIKNQKVLTS